MKLQISGFSGLSYRSVPYVIFLYFNLRQLLYPMPKISFDFRASSKNNEITNFWFFGTEPPEQPYFALQKYKSNRK